MAKNLHRLLVLLLSAMLSSVAWAGSSSTLQLHILVLGGCNFKNWGDVTMDFGNLAGGDKSISTRVPVNCSTGSNFKVTLDNGLHANGTQRRLAQKNGAGRVPYSLIATPDSGTGSGRDFEINLTATVTQNDYQASPIGQYSDTVIMTIEP
ncbi:spore coat protein U domain-containing protein [Chitinibacter bivalviorum]|uniref:Spore coat protein U domain-containing protein n=1 Tax=Chitinibacter bivalviorum TaxID=2739434 RepID=A0A7H9BML9_9NEIS|nr:spore coat protein U domain-containing protein [Chitinibacter bivalviorum]QLG89478.1 spore coat protein U domain-containing protein [Chitinibacter bivalviorum]